MNISLHSLIFPNPKDVLSRRVLKAVKRLGYSGIELIPIDCSHDDIQDLRSITDDLGLCVLLGWSLGPDENPISADEKVRKAAIARMRTLIEFSAILESPLLSGLNYAGAGCVTGVPPTRSEWEMAVEFYQNTCDYARNCSRVALCLEPATREDSHVINTVEQGVRFLRDVDRANAFLLLDTYQMLREEDSLERAIALAGSRIGHFHVSESHRGAPGKGTVPWAEVASVLASVNYRGWLGVEAFYDIDSAIASRARIWRQLGKDPLTFASEAIAFINSTFGLGHGEDRNGT